MRLSGSLACFFLAISMPPAAALAASGVFVTEESVDAVEQPESARVVFAVQPGVSYPLVKKGGPDRAWCKLQGAKAEGWVRCDGTPTDAVQKAPGTDALVRADHENTRQQQMARGGGAALAEAGPVGSGAGAPTTAPDDEEAGAVAVVRAPAGRAAAPGDAAACASTCEQPPLFAKHLPCPRWTARCWACAPRAPTRA
ncbi:hypothetical protein [Corallococcus sp. 4LFB]|uniref:hypothetical protein n=1 Tax=Corallococcus sp. 4LFB TaxID=3383249 RepID=UPI0039749444